MSLQNIQAPRKKTKSASSFLKKTFEMLGNPQNSSSIRWAKSGIGFIVVQEQRFSKDVLPQYFRHSNYSSFVRQLNMYNFHKIREGNSESYFHHELFDRNRKQLLSEIRRKPEKKKRKSGGESDDQQISILKIKENDKVQKSEIQLKNQRQLSEKEEKRLFYNTRHVFASEQDQAYREVEIFQERGEKNILSNIENEDDKISINNELIERIPRYPTKEIFYPSNHRLHPFPCGSQMPQFSFFF